MSITLDEALNAAPVALTEEEQKAFDEEIENKHRSRNVLERPKEEFQLNSLLPDDFEPRKEQMDPTDDLVILPRTFDDRTRSMFDVEKSDGGYVVWCADTQDVWYAPTKLCLDQNFIYRKDLIIKPAESAQNAYEIALEFVKDLIPGVDTRRQCYILDDPANETYEVYYDSAWPVKKYGKTTPDGMFILKFKNRFHRDMAIMEMDANYTKQSARKAGKLLQKEYGPNEVILISDGCLMRNSCAASVVYIDCDSLFSITEGFNPSEPEQGVLIAEIRGATNALRFARSKGKKDITYYYDNTSILNVYRNRKTEYIREVVEYKQLLEEMDDEGFNVKFVELHPKTGEERRNENRALMYFHNKCDNDSRDMSIIYKRDYKTIASAGNKEGSSYKDVKRDFVPHGRKGQSSGRYPRDNRNNGNNKYGRKR